MACQDHLAPEAHQALQGVRVPQDVMAKMDRKDQWDFQDFQGHLVFLGHLERRDYLALQAKKGQWVLQAAEVNLGLLQMWIPVLESQDFLECQAPGDQKEPWGTLDREACLDQGAKVSLAQMAGGARTASLDLPDLLDAKVTLERQVVLEHQVLLVQLVILGPRGLALDTSVASSWFSTVRQIKNQPALWACLSFGQDTACYTWKDRRRPTIKILVWQDLAFLCLAPCPLPTATSTRCATTLREMTNPTGCPVRLLFL